MVAATLLLGIEVIDAKRLLGFFLLTIYLSQVALLVGDASYNGPAPRGWQQRLFFYLVAIPMTIFTVMIIMATAFVSQLQSTIRDADCIDYLVSTWQRRFFFNFHH